MHNCVIRSNRAGILRARSGLSLAEVLVVSFFVGLMLVVVAALLGMFQAQRSSVEGGDERSRLSQLVLTQLGADLEGCLRVDSLAPDLQLTMARVQDTARLPVSAPTPLPAATPLWDPLAATVAVRYRLDSLRGILERDQGGVNQVFLEHVQGFRVQAISQNLYSVEITQLQGRPWTFEARFFRP